MTLDKVLVYQNKTLFIWDKYCHLPFVMYQSYGGSLVSTNLQGLGAATIMLLVTNSRLTYLGRSFLVTFSTLLRHQMSLVDS